MKKELVCINCPLGCMMTATSNEDGNIEVIGNTCDRGKQYAINEMTNPKRMVTSTVRIVGMKDAVLSVKTRIAIPKEKIMTCMEEIKKTQVTAPIEIGEVIIENVAGTGVDVIATKSFLGGKI